MLVKGATGVNVILKNINVTNQHFESNVLTRWYSCVYNGYNSVRNKYMYIVYVLSQHMIEAM